MPRAVALGFLFGWLLPVCYVGWLNRTVPNVPGYFNNMYSISGLFPNRAYYWSEYYFLAECDSASRYVPEELYSTMKPFGNRTRVKRMLEVPMAVSVWEKRTHEIAEFVFKRVPQEWGEVRALRLVQAKWITGDELAQQRGAWLRPAPRTLPDSVMQTIRSFTIDGDVLIPMDS